MAVAARDIIDLRPPQAIDLLVLPLYHTACPASVSAAARRSIHPTVFDRSPRFLAYLKRQGERQEAFYAAGGDLADFRAEEWDA